MSRSRGKAFDSLYNGHNTPSVQFLGSVSLVQPFWITSCNASTRLGPPFCNSRDRIRTGCFVVFEVFQRPSISSWLGKSMSTPSSLKSIGRVGCIDSEPSFKCSSKCSFHYASTWFLLVKSSPFLARDIAICGLNGRLTLFWRL
jgi:hypothetical protein